MARHRANNGLTLSRARHRAAGPVQRVLERGLRSAVVGLAAVMLIATMVGSDPSFHGRN